MNFGTIAVIHAAGKYALSLRGRASAPFFAGAAAALALCCAAAPASAGTLTYDANTTAPANDGAGAWNTTSANWYDGANDVLWSNGLSDTAVFGVGGVGGTVTVGTVNVGTIQFNPTVTTGYLLTGGTITLGTGIVTTTTTGAPGSTINSVITGTNGLAYSGASGSGVGITLGGANTYTGITTLSTGGRITLGNNAALGTSAGATASTLGTDYTQINNGTGISFTGQTAINEAFVINGTGNGNGALRFSNGSTLNSLIQLGSDSLISGAFSAGNVINGNLDLANHVLSLSNASGTINGLVSSTGGGGSITLSGNVLPLNLTNNGNSYAGTTTVGNNTLGLGGDFVLGSSTLAMGGTIQSTNATARTIANRFTTANTVFGATSVNTGALTFTDTTLTSLGAATSKTFTTNVDTTFNTPFSSGGTAATLTKLGAMTLALTGASTYSTQTIVSAGTLAVNNTSGSGTGTSAVSIASGATLTGTGSAAGTVTVSGTLNAGGVGAVGTLTTGAETFLAGSSLVFDFGNNAIDSLICTGSATGLNNATLTFTQLPSSGPLTQAQYTLMSASFFAGGTVLPTSTTTPAGYQLQLTSTSLNLVQTTATAASEPSEWPALGLGVLVLGCPALRARRHNRRAA